MQKKLLLAINEGSEGFGFAWFKNEEKKSATESDYVPSLKRGFSSRLETLESQEVLPENWFLKDGSLRDHGLDGEVEDLDIGRLSKDVFFFHDARSQEVGRTHFWLTTPKRLFLKLPIIECISYPCFLCSRCMITGTRPKGSISSFLGVTLVRTS